MDIKISALVFVLHYTVYCKPTESNDPGLDIYDDFQNDNDYGPDYPDEGPNAIEESSQPLEYKPLSIDASGETFVRNLSEKVVLPCPISGTYFVQIWRKKNVIEQNAEKKDAVLFQSGIGMAAAPNMQLLKDGSLEISNLHVQDGGDYECVAMDTEKNSPKIQHTVIMRVPPQIEFLEAKDNITILKSGDTLVLTCKANGYPKANISWHKGSDRLGIEGEVLQVTSVKHRDGGTYKCFADNRIGEPAFSYINIKVEHKPMITVERFSVSSENNSETQLECVVHSEPKAEVVWKKDGANIVENQRVRLTNKDTRHNLILKDLRDSDFGVYTCLATNYLGNSKKNIKLVKTPVVLRFTKSPSDAKEFTITWEVQSKSNVSEVELSYRKKGEDSWRVIKPEVSPKGNDAYAVKYVFVRGLDPGEYETQIKSQNDNGWSEYSEPMPFNVTVAKHGHHNKTHKKGHRQGKERQITPTPTPTLPSQSDVPAEHHESENQSGFIKESAATASESSGSSIATATALPISIVLITLLRIRLPTTRV